MRGSIVAVLPFLSWLPAQHGDVELPVLLRAGTQTPAGVPRMAEFPAVIAAGAAPAEPEACHLATFALFQTGGAAWQRWSERVAAELLPLQAAAGADAGAWPAAPGTSAVATTARLALALTSFHRYPRMVAR